MAGQLILPGTAVPAVVLIGNTFSGGANYGAAGTMPNKVGDNAALASSVSGTTLKLRAPSGFYGGVDDNVTLTDADFIAANIKDGVNIFGLPGTFAAKRWATGTGLMATGPNPNELAVSGLAFAPKIVIGVFVANGYGHMLIDADNVHADFNEQWLRAQDGTASYNSFSGWVLGASNFKFVYPSFLDFLSAITIRWLAIE